MISAEEMADFISTFSLDLHNDRNSGQVNGQDEHRAQDFFMLPVLLPFRQTHRRVPVYQSPILSHSS